MENALRSTCISKHQRARASSTMLLPSVPCSLQTGNVDLNVAVAMAAGLEWPVEGASFYNKRAKTVLRVGPWQMGG